jgi:hypothetical protein
MHKAIIHDPHQQIRTQTPQNRRNQRAISGKSTQLWKLPFTQRSDSLQIEEKSNPMEQGNEKQSGWMVCLETLELIYMSPSRARQKTTLPLALKLWYKPLRGNRSCNTPLHRTTMPSPQSASSRRKPCDPAMHPPASKLLVAPVSCLRPPSLRSWFCSSTK